MGPGGGAVVDVVVGVGTVVVVVVVTVAGDATAVVVITGAVLTLGAVVLVVVAVTGASTLLRGRKTLVVTSVGLATGSDASGSGLSFSTAGTGVSSLAANGLLAAFGLASELGARISGLSLMFSLIGGKLPNVLLF